nr:hypothetical protein Iba_chr02eCG3430 [Ipomoea batatas]GMD49387.1 hypothetical protein Iba_scaffold46756CG0220 [Ipomoea batatas]
MESGMKKCNEEIIRLLQRTEASSWGLGKSPDSNITISYVHHSRQIMLAEGIAKRTNSRILE